MTIPDNVDILGMPYAVVRDQCEEDENGFCSPSRRVICVREGLPDGYAAQVYLHELIHAVLFQLMREEGEDEQLVQGLAIGLSKALGL